MTLAVIYVCVCVYLCICAVLFELYVGFYMLANTGVNVLPQGSVTTLTSSFRSATSAACVHFWYHTGGENSGIKDTKTTKTHWIKLGYKTTEFLYIKICTKLKIFSMLMISVLWCVIMHPRILTVSFRPCYLLTCWMWSWLYCMVFWLRLSEGVCEAKVWAEGRGLLQQHQPGRRVAPWQRQHN